LATATDGVASQASGLARIDCALRLWGKGKLPEIDGTITFPDDDGQSKKAFTLVPRGLRRELAFLGGSLEISTQTQGAHRTYSLSVDDNPIVNQLLGTLERSGNDRVMLTNEASPRTSTTRLEIQEGVIKAIGSGMKSV